MEGALRAVGRWLVGPDAIPVIDAASVSLVRERVRERASEIGLGGIPAASLVNVASELANNQLAHAAGGYVAVRETVRGTDRGLEVVAADSGPGIRDVARALEGRPRGTGSLGVGLAAVLELADEVDLDVRIDEGTCVWARKFASSDTRRRRVGVYGRPFPGERTSGDDATFVRVGGALVAAVTDGLGHGVEAREAADRAGDVLHAHAAAEPDALLMLCHTELASTRGAVMTVVRLDEALDELQVASVGNVAAQIVGPSAVTRFGGSSFVLGARGPTRKPLIERRAMDRYDVLVLASDGVSSRADLTRDADLLREHPAVIAQRIVERFGRDNDDVTVLVVGI